MSLSGAKTGKFEDLSSLVKDYEAKHALKIDLELQKENLFDSLKDSEFKGDPAKV
jgi:hypothetical protein